MDEGPGARVLVCSTVVVDVIICTAVVDSVVEFALAREVSVH